MWIHFLTPKLRCHAVVLKHVYYMEDDFLLCSTCLSSFVSRKKIITQSLWRGCDEKHSLVPGRAQWLSAVIISFIITKQASLTHDLILSPLPSYTSLWDIITSPTFTYFSHQNWITIHEDITSRVNHFSILNPLACGTKRDHHPSPESSKPFILCVTNARDLSTIPVLFFPCAPTGKLSSNKQSSSLILPPQRIAPLHSHSLSSGPSSMPLGNTEYSPLSLNFIFFC